MKPPDYIDFVSQLTKTGKLRSATHCDAAVLHDRNICKYCSDPQFDVLHEFREQHGINYTGQTTRPFPCPSEKARSLKTINRWHGNVAVPHGCTCSMFQGLSEDKCPIHER